MEAGHAHETESRVYKTGKVSGLCCPKCITKMKRERVLLLEFLKGNQKVTKGCRGKGNVFFWKFGAQGSSRKALGGERGATP